MAIAICFDLAVKFLYLHISYICNYFYCIGACPQAPNITVLCKPFLANCYSSHAICAMHNAVKKIHNYRMLGYVHVFNYVLDHCMISYTYTVCFTQQWNGISYKEHFMAMMLYFNVVRSQRIVYRNFPLKK